MTTVHDLFDTDLIGDPVSPLFDLPSAPDRVNRLLHPSRARSFHEGDLLAIAEWIASGVDPSVAARRPLDGRYYRRVLATRSVEAWVLAWGASTFLGLHDHGGSRTAFQVVSGVLEERSTNLDSRALLATLQLRAGGRRSVAPRDVHEVWNPSEQPAVSVHVYSPPLSSMNFYAHDKDHYLEMQRTENQLDCPDA